MAAKGGGAPRKSRDKTGGGSKTAAAAKRRSEAQRRRRAEERARREAAHVEEQLAVARDGVVKAKGAARTVESGELYLAIFDDWLSGSDYGALAAKHGLSVKRIEVIVSDLRGHRLHTLRLGDPMLGLRVAQDLILRWTKAISEYAELARETKLDAVRLGALRRRDEALGSFKELMQELGYLPKHLGTLRIQEDFIALVEALLDKMDELGVDEGVQRALVEAVELRVARRGDRLVLDPGGVVDAEVVEDGQVAAA